MAAPSPGYARAVPTRKQRRREAKLRRHEWEEVYVDADGRELDADAVDVPTRDGRRKASEGRPGVRPAARGRVVQPPSWQRVLRRGAIFAPLMFLTVYFIAGAELTTAGKLMQTVFLLLVFMPFSFLMDTVTYRMWQRRQRADAGRAAARR